MIKLKNTGEYVLQSDQAGNATTGAKHVFVVPFACILKAVLVRIRTAGTTGTQSTDIQKNGTSIFSGATKLDFATTSLVPTYGALTTDPTAFAKGDVITINNLTVHTTPAVDTAIVMVLQRVKGSGAVGKMVTDSVGVEAEL